jgi:hypothetical protein
MITIEDKRGNLLQGEVVVSDKEKLIAFRNSLLTETYGGRNANFERIIPKTPSVAFDDGVEMGTFSKNGLLVCNTEFIPDYKESKHWVFDYTKEVIACNHLNTILLLSSLLNVPDRYYNTEMATKFYNAGIFDVSSFEDTWKRCSKNLLESGNVQDLEMFRNAFFNGCIVYQIKDSWLKEEKIRMNVLKTLGLDLNELYINTKVMGVDKVLSHTR